MQRFKSLLTFVMLFTALTAVSAGADTIKLKNGQVFEGLITAEESGRVQLKIAESGVQIWFPRDQISSLEKTSSQEGIQSKGDSNKPDTAGLDEDAVRARELLKKMREQPSNGFEKNKSSATGLGTGKQKNTDSSVLLFKGSENARVTITVFSDYQ
jgi:hypothetical protein